MFSRTEMSNLVSMASGFTKGNHVRFLSEAIQALRDTGDPIDALELLAALRGSGYAERRKEEEALNDVGGALARLIRRAPSADASRLLCELGWLKRLATCNPERHGAASHTRSTQDQWASPKFRDELRRLREPAPRPNGPRDAGAPGENSGTKRDTPTVLPDEFEAEFADVVAAREVRKARADRARKGKPAKEASVALRPVDRALSELARGLRCSTTRTNGVDEVFEALRVANTDTVRFTVRVVRRDGGLFAEELRIVPAAPAIGRGGTTT